jgi:hypothetical protein
MAEKLHRGSCHCGKVSYEVHVDLSAEVASCNCSMCSRKGWLLTFVPEDKFRLHGGEAQLTDYLFHKKVIHHLFCATCGVASFARAVFKGQPTVAVNVRCLEGVDLKALRIKDVDGARF